MTINKWFARCFFWICIAVACGFISACTVRIVAFEAERDKYFVDAGYEQVIQENKVIWQKRIN